MEYSQTIKLDIRDHNTYEQLFCKQSDKGYPLVFEIMQDKEPFDLTGASAFFQMIKPDGNVFLGDCTIEDNLVLIELDEQMTAAPGKGKFEIVLTDQDQRVTTITGVMKIDASAVDDGVISESVIQIIVRAIEAAEQAVASAEAAAVSETNARNSATKSQSYSEGGTGSREDEDIDNSKYYSEEAGASAYNASNSETNALTYSRNAETSATNASTSATNAASSATNAATSATNAATSEDNAKDSEEQALYYYHECQRIASELGSIIVPMGSVYFAELATVEKVVGHMYDVKDDFVTDNTFREGAGKAYPAGTNVYWIADAKWDIMAGAGVSGVKGDAEQTYRNGNVNITKANIGLGNVENKSSATIRGELTKQNVTDALGYTPINVVYSSTEPSDADIWVQPYTIGGE